MTSVLGSQSAHEDWRSTLGWPWTLAFEACFGSRLEWKGYWSCQKLMWSTR
uniref:Uncharacterized protein n=1 Tax=Rhizophora mucronata TaxID=61149 RepID=A0A2P2NXJ3_RHIMU